jgi:6-phosphogluconolactonase
LTIEKTAERQMNSRKLVLTALLAFFIAAPALRTAEVDGYLVYVGTYTRNASKGIYAYRFQPSTGKTVPIGLVAEAVNPSFLVVHPNRHFLYAANEVSDGYVSAFSIDPKTGLLKFLNKVSSGGADPCHVTIDRSGKWLMAANYSSGSVSVLQLQEDGTLGKMAAVVQHSGSGVNPQRQEGPHAHSVNLSPDNRFLLVSDLGLDKLMIYRFHSNAGTLKPNDPPFAQLKPGSGPRHLSFHPNGRFLYGINELNNTIAAFVFDSVRGSLSQMEAESTLPKGFSGSSTTAEIAVDNAGSFLYGSNRGHDSIAVYAIGNEGKLGPAGHFSTGGKAPRHFALDPTGKYLFAANQDSDTVVLFRVDRKTGALALTGTTLQVPTPVCVVFVAQRQV